MLKINEQKSVLSCRDFASDLDEARQFRREQVGILKKGCVNEALNRQLSKTKANVTEKRCSRICLIFSLLTTPKQNCVNQLSK